VQPQITRIGLENYNVEAREIRESTRIGKTIKIENLSQARSFGLIRVIRGPFRIFAECDYFHYSSAARYLGKQTETKAVF
jgi:hypothetical protein